MPSRGLFALDFSRRTILATVSQGARKSFLSWNVTDVAVATVDVCLVG